MNRQQKKVVEYYEHVESRLGYTFLTWDTKHFGYYPSKRASISERKAQKLTVDLLAKKLQVKKSDLILDAGCGRGTVACYIAKKYGASLLGIDIVPFELELAKERAKKNHLNGHVTFSLQNYSQTNFPDNCFNKIFTLETFVHTSDITKTLNEFYRVLKPGGKLVMFEYTRSFDADFSAREKKMFDLVISESAMQGFAHMFHDKFIGSLKKAGFTHILVEDITSHMEPSLKRFYNIASIPYQLIRLLHLQKYFINTTAAVEFYKLAEKDLVRYRIFVAEKSFRKNSN